MKNYSSDGILYIISTYWHSRFKSVNYEQPRLWIMVYLIMIFFFLARFTRHTLLRAHIRTVVTSFFVIKWKKKISAKIVKIILLDDKWKNTCRKTTPTCIKMITIITLSCYILIQLLHINFVLVTNIILLAHICNTCLHYYILKLFFSIQTI